MTNGHDQDDDNVNRCWRNKMMMEMSTDAGEIKWKCQQMLEK